MTEQELDRVRVAVQAVIDEKERDGIGPALATQIELREKLMGMTEKTLLDCMRELHNLGEYRGGKTINFIPLLCKI